VVRGNVVVNWPLYPRERSRPKWPMRGLFHRGQPGKCEVHAGALAAL